MEKVLTILEKHQFYAKKSKCTFWKEEIEYLRHIISMDGVKVDRNKLNDIREWTKPVNFSKLTRFLRLTGYYRRLIENYAHITSPLSNLLKNNSLQWNDEVEKCFEDLMEVMSNSPVLATLGFSKPFVIECDA